MTLGRTFHRYSIPETEVTTGGDRSCLQYIFAGRTFHFGSADLCRSFEEEDSNFLAVRVGHSLLHREGGHRACDSHRLSRGLLRSLV